MKKSLFLLWLLPTLTFGADPFTPIIPTRGEPPLLSYSEYPIEKWRSKSTNDFGYFVEKPNGWYINFGDGLPIRALVVHHSAGSGFETPEQLSQTNKERTYAPVFKSEARNPYIVGLPVHSGLVIDGKETFIGYHFIVYPEGRIVTTLVPHKTVNGKFYADMVAWGAGNWQMNRQSVQACLLGNFTKTNPPSKAQLDALERIIGFYRSKIPELQIASHDAVRLDGPKECPGGWFPGWLANYLAKP